MSKMTGGPAAAWHPGMTTVDKRDIRNMKPGQRNRYRRQGFTWAEIKKFDRAIGRGDSTVTLTSPTREITLTLPPGPGQPAETTRRT
ncbi:hypothetical protein ACFWA9_27355 [Kitasatospora sp. NPDC059973]|uniref:hypothetical protein n=1 Tax=Kitasatospora sp. NPDC059973 TaxID=3347020 RepID=UPI0036A4549A